MPISFNELDEIHTAMSLINDLLVDREDRGIQYSELWVELSRDDADSKTNGRALGVISQEWDDAASEEEGVPIWGLHFTPQDEIRANPAVQSNRMLPDESVLAS